MSRSQLTRRVDALETCHPPGRIWVIYPEDHETTTEALARERIFPQSHDTVLTVRYEDTPGGSDA